MICTRDNVRGVITQVLPTDRTIIDDDTRLNALNITTTDQKVMLMELEDEFRMRFNAGYQPETVGDVITYVVAHSQQS